MYVFLCALALVVPPPTTIKTQAVYTVVTAFDGTSESDFSKELRLTATNGSIPSIVWNAGKDPTSGYYVYWGTNSGDYLYRYQVGTNRMDSWQVFPAVSVSNVIVFYLQTSSTTLGPWVEGTNVVAVATNTGEAVPRFFRLRGEIR